MRFLVWSISPERKEEEKRGEERRGEGEKQQKWP